MFGLAAPDARTDAGTYFVRVNGFGATDDPPADYTLALDAIGLGAAADQVLAAENPVGEAIRYADVTDPAANPATRDDGRALGVSFFRFSTCDGEAGEDATCFPVPECGGAVYCGVGTAPAAATDYTAAAIRYESLPDLSATGSQISMILTVEGGQVHIPIEAFPGDGFGGSSHQASLGNSAAGLGFYGQATQAGFAQVPTIGFAVLGDETVVIVVATDAFGAPIIGFGMMSHIHDGRFGSTPDSSSRFHTWPQWPDGGGPRTEIPNIELPLINSVVNSSFRGEVDLTTGRVVGAGFSADTEEQQQALDQEAIDADAATVPETAPGVTPSSGGNGLTFVIGGILFLLLLMGIWLYLRKQKSDQIGIRPAGERSSLAEFTLASFASSSPYSSPYSRSAYSPVHSPSPYDSSSYDPSYDPSYESSPFSPLSPTGGLDEVGRVLRDEMPDEMPGNETNGGMNPMSRLSWRLRRLGAPARDRSGSPVQPARLGFAAGKLTRDGSVLDGRFIYVLDRKGRFTIAEARHPEFKRPYHTDLLPRGRAYGAGEFRVEDGELIKVSDSSGHFRPGAAQILAVLDRLAERGVSLDAVEVSFRRRTTTEQPRIIVTADDILAARTLIGASIRAARRYTRTRPWAWDRGRDAHLRRLLDGPLPLLAASTRRAVS